MVLLNLDFFPGDNEDGHHLRKTALTVERRISRREEMEEPMESHWRVSNTHLSMAFHSMSLLDIPWSTYLLVSSGLCKCIRIKDNLREIWLEKIYISRLTFIFLVNARILFQIIFFLRYFKNRCGWLPLLHR